MFDHKNCLRGLALAFALSQGLDAQAFRVANFVNHQMVLQREAPVSLCGTVDPGEKVTVSFAGATVAAAVTNGRWRVELPPLKACKQGRNLVVSGSGGMKAVYRDVLVGDVWVCSGQSNMDPRWAGIRRCCTAENHKDALAMAKDLPFVRCSNGGRDVWQKPEGNVGDWSAPAWFFAAKLARELDVPQGIVVTAVGGSCIEPWTSQKGYRLTPGCERFVRAMDAMDPATATGKAAFAETMARIDAWQKKTMEMAAKGVRNNEAVPALPDIGQIRNFSQYYRSSIEPLTKMRIRGVIWYQGESNAKDADYDVLMQALVNGWRADWGYAFPFYFVQLANYREVTAEPAGGAGFAAVRDCQRRALRRISRSGMACAIDVGERNNIHPRNKRDVGERLARWALAKEFGRDVVPSGPLFRELRREGNRLRIAFDYAAGGLVTAKKDALSFAEPVVTPEKPLGGFAVAGKDGVWQWAEAVIDGETVVVSSPKVSAPCAVRYAYDGDPSERANLYGKAALLPAVPFSETL